METRKEGGSPSFLDGLDDLVRSKAAGANPQVLPGSIEHDMDPLQIGALDALRLDVGVANVIGHPTLFTANITLSWHGFSGGAYH